MFVAFEGIDGSGKSTQAGRFAEFLRSEERATVECVREPGGTALGERVRSLVLDPATGEMAVEAEAFLFMAARAQLVSEVIAPALSRGDFVVADRFLWSSVVYQGVVGALGVDVVRSLGDVATRSVLPGVTFLIDLDPDVAFSRLSADLDRIEGRGLSFLRRLRDAYLAVAERYPGDIVVVDGSGRADQVAERVIAAYRRRSP